MCDGDPEQDGAHNDQHDHESSDAGSVEWVWDPPLTAALPGVSENCSADAQQYAQGYREVIDVVNEPVQGGLRYLRSRRR